MNISGETIHFWGNYRMGDYYTQFHMMMEKDVRAKICATYIILINEVSMLRAHLFDVLECMIAIIRYLLHNHQRQVVEVS